MQHTRCSYFLVVLLVLWFLDRYQLLCHAQQKTKVGKIQLIKVYLFISEIDLISVRYISVSRNIQISYFHVIRPGPSRCMLISDFTEGVSLQGGGGGSFFCFFKRGGVHI